MSLGGVKAPKDPLKKGKGFTVYKELKIEATKRADGRRTQEIYLDGGRIKNAAEIMAGIKNKEILDCFDTAEGLKKLLTGMGITINAVLDNAPMNFGIIMYGNTDLYNSGTHVYKQILTGGVEQFISFDGIDWSDDDKILGQFQIEFPDELTVADLTVRLYAHDTYDIPEEEADDDIDFASVQYKKMIENSLVAAGNNERFLRAVKKAEANQDVTIAFIGGSITQGAGAVPTATECYAYKAYKGFVDRFAKGNGDNIHYVKAGIGGTSSELGVARYDKDVCQFGAIEPDIVFIEFAVNDEGDETKGDCYEGLMRKVWNKPYQPAVVLMFSVFSYDWNLQERFIPMGEAYGIPMVSVKDAVVPQFALSSEEGRIVSKRQFFYDMFHPTNVGHTIMADCICNYYDVALKNELTQDNPNPPIIRSADFENVVYFDRKYSCDDVEINEGAFTKEDTELQFVERDLDDFQTPMFPDNWMRDTTINSEEPFICKLSCKLLLMLVKDSASNDIGKASVKVDGKEVMVYDPHEVGWTHCNAVIVIREDEVKEHIVEISMVPGCEKQSFTILGFGYVRD